MRYQKLFSFIVLISFFVTQVASPAPHLLAQTSPNDSAASEQTQTKSVSTVPDSQAAPQEPV